MARSGGDGIRYQVRRLAETTIDELNFDFVEAITGHLSKDTKSDILWFSELYATVGPQHDLRRTVLSSEIRPLLQKWAKASNKLKSAIAYEPREKNGKQGTNRNLSRADVTARFYGVTTAHQLAKMLPLRFLDFFASAALDAATVVAAELKDSPTIIKNHLWECWVAVIAVSLRKQGFKVTISFRASINKTSAIVPVVANAYFSPFVRLIIFLQDCLPNECRRTLSDESLCSAIRQALRNASHLSRNDLETILSGYGAGLLGRLPKGGLRAVERNQARKIKKLLRTRSASK